MKNIKRLLATIMVGLAMAGSITGCSKDEMDTVKEIGNALEELENQEQEKTNTEEEIVDNNEELTTEEAKRVTREAIREGNIEKLMKEQGMSREEAEILSIESDYEFVNTCKENQELMKSNKDAYIGRYALLIANQYVKENIDDYVSLTSPFDLQMRIFRITGTMITDEQAEDAVTNGKIEEQEQRNNKVYDDAALKGKKIIEELSKTQMYSIDDIVELIMTDVNNKKEVLNKGIENKDNVEILKQLREELKQNEKFIEEYHVIGLSQNTETFLNDFNSMSKETIRIFTKRIDFLSGIGSDHDFNNAKTMLASYEEINEKEIISNFNEKIDEFLMDIN